VCPLPKGSKFQFAPKISPKWKIIIAKTAQNEPKLRFMAELARLCENTKVAQKLCSTTSQFSGGTKEKEMTLTVACPA